MAANTTGHIFGMITGIDLPRREIEITALDGDYFAWCWANNFENDEHFARLLQYYQAGGTIVTFRRTGFLGMTATDVQIFSWVWYGIPEQDRAQ